MIRQRLIADAKKDDLLRSLTCASRVLPTGPSSMWLKRHVNDPDVLDYLEGLVKKDDPSP